MTDGYMASMENYSPNASGTGAQVLEMKIIEVNGAPKTTSFSEEVETMETPKYMAPKTIEVRRYTLKK